VVESDVVRSIKEIDATVDLESDVSPVVAYRTTPPDSRFRGDPTDPNLLRAQTEVFIGQRFDLAGPQPWKEDATRRHIPGLTVLDSSNPLFADNALHNGNVLSMIDSFEYTKNGQKSHLQSAQCDYFVIGWHANPTEDPLNDPKAIDLASRLSDLLLKPGVSFAQSLLADQTATRSLVHGAIYDVKYDFNYNPALSPDPSQNPPDPTKTAPRSLANEIAHNFTSNVEMEPLAVGTTPLDGILTFLDAHKKTADQIFGQGANDLANSILNIAQLLYATGDDYDARVQAQDIIAQQNFSKVDGGSTWIYSKTASPSEPAAWPSVTETATLAELNEKQARLNISNRKLVSLQWDLFAEWWKYVSKFIADQDVATVRQQSQGHIDGLMSSIGTLQKQIETLKAEITSKGDATFCKSVPNEPFRLRMDPTLSIAGVPSGWPSDWQESLVIRLDRDLATDSTKIDATIFASSSIPVPPDHGLAATAKKILAECIKNSSTSNGGQSPPTITGFQSWGNRNPFVPIQIEWEGIYYHVPKEKWDVQLRPSPIGHNHTTVRYTPTERLFEKDENHTDFRVVKGQVMVLPQPVFSLETLVNAALDSAAAKDVNLTEEQKKSLQQNIQQISFISAPLTGITTHLLTRYEGSHVKPNIRQQGEASIPLAAALRPEVHLDNNALQNVESATAFTPYGDSFPFTDSLGTIPFKPVTHGQIVITKLNIIDKFGQAVCLPKIQRRLRAPVTIPTSNIYPCLSDWLSPDIIDSQDGASKVINTVLPASKPSQPGEWPLCQYIQLTPAINQDARINGAFLIRDNIQDSSEYGTWRETTDYDSMIWGWVIPNYADNGIQLFLGDGTFYREIRKGGVGDTNVSPKWLPYDPPEGQAVDKPRDAGEAQLSQLVEKLRDIGYFQKFSDIINGAIQNMPFAPSDYSGYASAIIGKPLALVNVGWSIELGASAIKPQNTLGLVDPNIATTLANYQFPLKIGDIERTYDGVVGYWNADNSSQSCTTHWDTLYTYFYTSWSNLPAGCVLQLPGTNFPRPTYTVHTGDTIESISKALTINVAAIKAENPRIPELSPTDKFKTINSSNFPRLSPKYVEPTIPTSVLAAQALGHTVTSMLVDPYASMHGYSPILPTKRLTLPPWAVQAAFRKMHAFFRLGPLLLTSDVAASREDAQREGTFVKLPVSGKKGTWTWFQPYTDAADADALEPKYAQVEVRQDLGETKFVNGPYTFVEGFLQLEGNLQQQQA
jgi:hypothetical protein